MDVRIQAVGFTARPELVDFTQRKLDRMERFIDDVQHAEVVLKTAPGNERNRHASVRLFIPGADLFAEKEAATFEEAIDGSLDALKKQIERRKEGR